MKRMMTLVVASVFSALVAFTSWAGDQYRVESWDDGSITWEYTLDNGGATIV